LISLLLLSIDQSLAVAAVAVATTAAVDAIDLVGAPVDRSAVDQPLCC
jgi:hypothetical protein